jgi:DNA-binding transcriptional MerR regulator
MNTEDKTWRIGELAKVTGISVRSLHHYDAIGLLQPTQRSSAGHRLYSGADVRRLHRVVALRGFGLTLAEIGQVLDGELGDPRKLVRRQLEQVDEQLATANRLRRTLLGVLGGLDKAKEPSTEKLIELIEGMTAMTRALTREEFDELNERRRAWRESMSPEEVEAAAEGRRKSTEGLSAEELEKLNAQRAALMPTD